MRSQARVPRAEGTDQGKRHTADPQGAAEGSRQRGQGLSGHHSVFRDVVGTALSLPWEAKTEEQISAAMVTDSLCQAEAA